LILIVPEHKLGLRMGSRKPGRLMEMTTDPYVTKNKSARVIQNESMTLSLASFMHRRTKY
jgi:hypothetical protein